MITEITVIWHIGDVKGLARERYNVELSDDEAAAILEEAGHRHDAEIGINWDVLDVYISDLLSTRNATNDGKSA